MAETKRAVGYIRRSTAGQAGSLPEQKSAIIEYAKKENYKIVGWYSDDAISGDSIEKRPDFCRMRDDAARGGFQFILCWDHKRFGRFDSIDGGYAVRPLRAAGVTLVLLGEGPIDWDSPIGRMMFGMKSEGAKQDNVDLSRNVARGQLEAALNGGWIGGVPYAYRLTGKRKNKRLEIDDDNPAYAKIVKRIFREYVGGRSMSAIAAGLNADGVPSSGGRGKPWRFDGCKSILENPAYVGDYVALRAANGKYSNASASGKVVPAIGKKRKPPSEWITHADHHPAIIDRATFAAARAILARGKTGRSTKHPPDDNPYLLSGLLRCGKCNRAMHGIERRGGRCVYECSARKYGTCPGTTVREDDVFKCLVRYIETEILPGRDRERIKDKAQREKLAESDLPGPFRKLKKMLFGDVTKRNESRDVNEQIAALNRKISQARENLAVVKRENVPAVESSIERFETECAELQTRLRDIPAPADVNQIVLDLLRKLSWLAKLADGYTRDVGGHSYANIAWGLAHRTDVVKPILRELDSITCHTKINGTGTGRRHTFLGGDVRFRKLGTVTGNVNRHQLG